MGSAPYLGLYGRYWGNTYYRVTELILLIYALGSVLYIRKNCPGALLCCSRLRIWHGHGSTLGHCCGLSSFPGAGTSTCCRHGKNKYIEIKVSKKKKKEKETEVWGSSVTCAGSRSQEGAGVYDRGRARIRTQAVRHLNPALDCHASRSTLHQLRAGKGAGDSGKGRRPL